MSVNYKLAKNNLDFTHTQHTLAYMSSACTCYIFPSQNSKPEIKPERESEQEPYQPEFPTAFLLTKAQVEYADWRTKNKPNGYAQDKDVPFPPLKKKEEDFPPGTFDRIDEHIERVSIIFPSKYDI